MGYSLSKSLTVSAAMLPKALSSPSSSSVSMSVCRNDAAEGVAVAVVVVDVDVGASAELSVGKVLVRSRRAAGEVPDGNRTSRRSSACCLVELRWGNASRLPGRLP